MLLQFLQKETSVICYFPSTQWEKEAALDPWKQTAILQNHCGISPPLASVAFQADWWGKRDSAEMLSICQNDLVWNYHAWCLANNVILMYFTVHCELRHIQGRKQSTNYWFTDSICKLLMLSTQKKTWDNQIQNWLHWHLFNVPKFNYPKWQTIWRDQVWQEHIKFS